MIHQRKQDETCVHHIDIELQQLAEKLMIKVRSIVAIDPKTEEY